MKEWKKQIGTLFLVFMMVLTIFPSQVIIKAEETKESFTVHYHKNNGTKESIDKEYASKEDSIEDGNLFTWEGKTFVEWNLQEDGKGDHIVPKTKLSEVIKEETTLDVYAIWKDNSYTVTFMDTDKDTEATYKKQQVQNGVILFPQYTGKKSGFEGWKKANEDRIYKPNEKIKISKNEIFYTVYKTAINKEKNVKASKITSIQYLSGNYESSKIEVSSNWTKIIEYPAEFRESGLERRKFLYWTFEQSNGNYWRDAYFGKDVYKLYPGDEINEDELKEHVNIFSDYITLVAVYDNENQLSLEYLCDGDIIKSVKANYSYTYDEKTGLYHLSIVDEVKMPTYALANGYSTVYKWYTGYPPKEYEPDETYHLDYNVYLQDLVYAISYGSIRFNSEINGIKIIYDIGDAEGTCPKDDNIYGNEEGQKQFVVLSDGEGIHKNGSVLKRWSFNIDHHYDLGQKVNVRQLAKLTNSSEVRLTAEFMEFRVDIYDVAEDLNITIPELGSDWVFPDLSDQVKGTDYIFIGWKDEYDSRYQAMEPIDNFNRVYSPIIVEKGKFNISYECDTGIECPVDNNTYTIGDEIQIQTPKGVLIDGANVFTDWMSVERYVTVSPGIYTASEYFSYLNNNTHRLELKGTYHNLNDDLALYILPNGNNVKMENDQYILNNYVLPIYDNLYPEFDFYNVMPKREGYAFIGWSTTPDNKGDNNKFFSYWTTKSYDIYDYMKSPDCDARILYAQWIPLDEISKDPNYIRVTMRRDLGNGKILESSAYVPKVKDLNLNIYNFIKANGGNYESEFFNALYYLPYGGKNLYLQDGEERIFEVKLPQDKNEVTYNLSFSDIDLVFTTSIGGKYVSSDGEERRNFTDTSEYLHTIAVPDIKAERGYVFKGWELSGVLKENILARAKENGAQNTIKKIKNDLLSTEELKKLVLYEDTFFNNIPIENRNIETILSNLIAVYIHAVFEPLAKTSATIEYYYDGIKDDKATETVKDVYVGDKIETYIDKVRDNYKLDKTEGLPLTLKEHTEENVIKVYYIHKKTSVTIKYYYDGVEDKEAAYQVDELAVGSHYGNYEDKKKENYTFALVEIPETLVEDASRNIIRVYYTRIKTIAKVQYFYDGKLDDNQTTIITDLKAGDVINTYPEKNKEGYHFVKSEHLPLTLSSIAAENVINIYYEKDAEESKTTSVTVKYYYDGVEDKNASYQVDELEVGSQYKNYVDKKKKHYSLAEVKIPEKLVEDASQNVIEVYYTRTKTIAKVQYFYDGKLDDSKTEIIADLKAGDVVETYPEKNKEGYIFEKVENIPLTLGEDASKNIIKVYYVKKKDTEPTPPKEDPQKPTTPSKPTTEKPKPEDEVQTSDTSQRTLWIMMVLLSGGAVLAYGLKRRKKEKQ